MFARLLVAVLLSSSPAIAGDTATDIKVDQSGQAYRIKKVCHTVEVAGSFIPRTSCTNKKILVKQPDAEPQEARAPEGSADGGAPAEKEQ